MKTTHKIISVSPASGSIWTVNEVYIKDGELFTADGTKTNWTFEDGTLRYNNWVSHYKLEPK
jgi:hypothetical protein